MQWSLEEAISYYKSLGAPGDQNALTELLREIQRENGGSIPACTLEQISEAYGIRSSFLQAVIQRIPSLRLGEGHSLILCAGPNCGKHAALAICAEKLCAASKGKVSLQHSMCMRMCGKGPNIKWDGKLYHHATEALLRGLFSDAGISL